MMIYYVFVFFVFPVHLFLFSVFDMDEFFSDSLGFLCVDMACTCNVIFAIC